MLKIILSSIEWVSHTIYLTDIAFALLGLFIFSTCLNKITHKGPMLWPVFGILPTLLFHINDVYDWVTVTLINTNGTFRYRGMWLCGLHGLVTADSSKIEYMLKTCFQNFPKGDYFKQRFHDVFGDGIFNADGELWKEQRRIVDYEMHRSEFVEFSMNTVQRLVHEKLLKVIENVMSSGECIDLQDVFLRFAFDNICVIALGVDSMCLGLDLPEIPFAKAFENATELSMLRFLMPHFVWKAMRYFKVGFEKRLEESIRVVHAFVEKTVTNRRMDVIKHGRLYKNHADLLSRLIEIENQYKQEEGSIKTRFSNNFIKDLCMTIILAGRDTSSVALARFFWLIHKNPPIEKKILREINAILSRRQSKKDEIDAFTKEELNKMVYLHAALSESLRLYPSVPIDFKEAIEDDVFPDGTLVKKGAKIFYSIFSMGRMESIWGKDCLEFKPERWIDKDGKFMRKNQFMYVVFNGGPRLCPGKESAYMQMKMVVASILVRYQVKIVEGHNVVPKVAMTLYMKNGLLVSFSPRLGLK